MSFNFKFILLLIGFCAANKATAVMNSRVGDQNNLMEFMTLNRDASSQNPQRSTDCFGYYIPVLNSITAEYERSYKICIQKSNDAKTLVDNSTEEDRKSIESSSKDACRILSDCSQSGNSVDYFQCYVDGGAENSKTMYLISTNASDVLVDIREKYRLIENDQYRCTNASERAYVENTANTYDDLQNCILGLSSVPSNPAVPTSPPVEAETENTFVEPPVFGRQAETPYAKDSQQYFVEEEIKKYEKPYNLY